MTILRALLEITIYSTALFGAILLFRAVCKKKASPALLYAAWFILIARLLMPVTVSGVSLIVLPAQEPAMPAQQIVLPPAGNDMAAGGEVLPQSPYTAAEEAWAVEQYAADDTQTASAAAADRAAVREFDWVTMLVALWIAGMAAMLVNTAVAFGRLSRRLAIAPALPERWQELAQRIRQEMGIRAHVRFVMLGSFPSPALGAGLRPTVVMPMELMWQEDEKMIGFALRHELMHIKRGDHRMCLLLMLLKAVYWFNPVVWLAARLMKMDMETACDSMVVWSMGGETKKQYAAAIVSMYAKAQPRFVLGMALGHTRQTAEKRLRGIFMRSRSSRGTVAAAMVLTAVMVLACFTTACQPVTETGPENIAAITPEPAAAIATAPRETPSVPELSPVQAIDRVSRWQETLRYDRLTCHIDAEVVWPETDVFPVYEMRERELDAAISTKLANYFTQGATGMRENSPAREDLEKQIKYIKKYYAKKDQKAAISELKKKLESTGDEVFGPVNNEILAFSANYKYAMPDGSSVYIQTGKSWALMCSDFYTDFGVLQMESWVKGGYAIPGEPPGTTLQNVKISEQEAVRQASAAVQGIGIENLGVAGTEKARIVDDYSHKTVSEGWFVLFARNDAGSIPLYIERLTGWLSYQTSSMDKGTIQDQETLGIYVDEKGIRYFSWRHPLEVAQVLKSDAQIMPFEEIKRYITGAFESGCTSLLEAGMLADRKLDIAVEKVVLGNVLALKEGKLVRTPAWFVYYYDTNLDRSGENASVLAVDATDGSLIDISSGHYSYSKVAEAKTES